jgi:hypothetical protein
MLLQSGGALTPAAPSSGSGCTNTPPSSDYTCAQQVGRLHSASIECISLHSRPAWDTYKAL